MQLKLDNPMEMITDYYTILTPQHFDMAVKGLKAFVGTYENDDCFVIFHKPGLALRLGHNLAKMSKIKYGLAFRKDDSKGEKQADRFSKMLSNEWADTISSFALATLKLNKLKKNLKSFPSLKTQGYLMSIFKTKFLSSQRSSMNLLATGFSGNCVRQC